jgi:hypothetical protein
MIRVDAERGKEIRLEKTAAICTSLDFKANDPQAAVREALETAGSFDELHAAHARGKAYGSKRRLRSTILREPCTVPAFRMWSMQAPWPGSIRRCLGNFICRCCTRT